jgi:hypothetical protein
MLLGFFWAFFQFFFRFFLAKEPGCGSMRLALHRALARQLYAGPALHVAETRHKPDFQDRNMSKSKCALSSCGIDATAQAKLVPYKVEIPAKKKKRGVCGRCRPDGCNKSLTRYFCVYTHIFENLFGLLKSIMASSAFVAVVTSNSSSLKLIMPMHFIVFSILARAT